MPNRKRRVPHDGVHLGRPLAALPPLSGAEAPRPFGGIRVSQLDALRPHIVHAAQTTLKHATAPVGMRWARDLGFRGVAVRLAAPSRHDPPLTLVR